jgi:hypothetical protein
MSSKFLYADSDEIEIVIEKANPYRDASTGRFTTGGGGVGLTEPKVSEGKMNETYFEKQADEAYKTGTEDEFVMAYTGDESTAALGTYLAKGHMVNDHIRSGDMEGYLTDERKVSDVVSGLDNAIEMAPPMPKQTVFRVGNAEAVGKLRKGSIYEDKGFTSTTATDLTHPDNGIQLLTLAKVSSGQKAIMRINTGKEGKGIYMPKMFPNQPIAEFEKEFLMPRNTKMKYLGEDYLFLDNGSAIKIHDFKVVE